MVQAGSKPQVTMVTWYAILDRSRWQNTDPVGVGWLALLSTGSGSVLGRTGTEDNQHTNGWSRSAQCRVPIEYSDKCKAEHS